MKQTIENDERCSANPTSANDGMNEGRKATLGVGLVALVWTGDLGSLVRLPILPADLRTPDRRSAFGDRLALQMQNADVYPLNVWLFLIFKKKSNRRWYWRCGLDWPKMHKGGKARFCFCPRWRPWTSNTSDDGRSNASKLPRTFSM